MARASPTRPFSIKLPSAEMQTWVCEGLPGTGCQEAGPWALHPEIRPPAAVRPCVLVWRLGDPLSAGREGCSDQTLGRPSAGCGAVVGRGQVCLLRGGWMVYL